MNGLEFIRRLFNSEREEDLNKPIIPEQGQVNLSVFEKEPENTQIYDITNAIGGYMAFGLGTGNNDAEGIKSLIRKYREMSLVADINDAIDEIVHEAIIKTDGDVVEISLEDTELSDNIKDEIQKEFKYLINLMDFQYKGDEYFRQWYIDGRLYSQNIFNVNDKNDGIIGFEPLSPFNLERVKTKEGKQYYIYKIDQLSRYNNFSMFGYDYSRQHSGFVIPEEHINFTPSGLKDANDDYYISYLHKAIVPYNQLKLLEDGAVIYTMTRAVERRHFKVKTGKLSQSKSEALVRDMMDKFKNRIVYDRSTGSVLQRKDVMTITEDFWSAASDDGRGIDIDSIQGGTQLRDMVENMEYYKRNMLRSLKVPYGRFDLAGSTINFGDNAKEINREELRFAKFINGLRDKFARGLFVPMLKKHLYLKGVLDLDEFDKIYNKIQFDWAKDQYFEEIAAQERLRSKVEILGAIDGYIGKGKYFSKKYAYDVVLNMTEEEIESIQKEMELEDKLGIVSTDNDEFGGGMEEPFGGPEVPTDGAIDMTTNEPIEEPETPEETTPETEEQP